MAKPCFYNPDLTHEHQEIELSGFEASHAIKSRRLRVRDAICLINGKGLVADGIISQLNRRDLTIVISDRKQHPAPSSRLSLATAVPKGDRQKNLVDIVTQLGVGRLVPLQCERSVSKVSESTIEKWQRVAIEACKQSHNPWLPEIKSAQRLEEFLAYSDTFIVYAGLGGQCLTEVVSDSQSLCIVVGPEGGFSPSELALLAQQKVPSITLGPNILRTEAAAITAAAHWVQHTAR